MPPVQSSPGAPVLLLVPTRAELDILVEQRCLAGSGAVAQLAGFGPVAAAASAATWLERLRPRRVILVGLCGTMDPARLPVGSATSFATVRLDGVGAGRGPTALGPREMGLAMWDTPEVHDELELTPARASDDASLLTVCSASGDTSHAQERRERHPGAIAEEMEGFSVALSCRLAGVPLTIIRGAGNVCGDRDRSGWRFDEALGAAGALLRETLGLGAGTPAEPTPGAAGS